MDNDIVDFNFFQKLRIDGFIDLCIGGRNVAIYAEFDWSRIFQPNARGCLAT